MENRFYQKAAFHLSEDSVSVQVTPDKSLPDFFFRIQSVGEFKTLSPYFTDRGGMESFLIILTLRGQGRLTYGEKTFELKAGDCLFIDCLHPHRYETAGAEGWDFLYVHFIGGNSVEYYREFVRDTFQTVHLEDTFVVESALRRILTVNLKRDRNTDLICSNLIGNILTELLISAGTGDAPTVHIPGYIRAIMREMGERYAEEMTLDHFAAQHSVSKFHLAKEFRRCIGTTVHEYLISLRISHAKELLIYSDLPVAEIAEKVGTPNISHFINLFKARENQTPLAYRKQWQERG